MGESDDQQLDAELEAFFREALDGQRGRAERAFRRHLAAQPPRAINGWKRNVWMIGSFGFGAAVAASVAVLWASPLLHLDGRPGHDFADRPQNPTPPITRTAFIPPAVEQDVQSQLVDEGTMVLGDQTPVHVYRRRQIERTKYFGRDAKVLSEQVVPQDDVIFIKLTTH